MTRDRVEYIHSAAGRRDPHFAVSVDQELARGVARQRGRIVRIVAIAGKGLRARVEAGDAAVLDRDPQISGTIFANRPDVIPGEALSTAPLMGKVTKRVSVVAIETGLGGDPQEAARVLQRREDSILRESLVDRQVSKHHGYCGGSPAERTDCRGRQTPQPASLAFLRTNA